MSDAQRKAFEEGHIETDAIFWDGEKYQPSNPGAYAVAVAQTANNLYVEFKRGWQAATEQGDQVVGRVYHTPAPNTVELNSVGRELSDGAALYAKPVSPAEQGVGEPDRCPHGIRKPHPCDDCQDSVETEEAIMWQAYETVAEILEPYIVRSPHSTGFLPDSVVESVQMLLEYRLSHPPKPTGGGVPDENELWSVLEAATEAMNRKALPVAYISLAWNAGAEFITKRRVRAQLNTQQPPEQE